MRFRFVRYRGFTLIELLAVILIIAVICVGIISTAGYIQGRANAQRVRGHLVAMATALEVYKSDFGYYPATYAERLSADGTAESRNNARLYRALVAGGRRYYTPPSRIVRLNAATNLTNLWDDWDMPFVYYCSPTTAYGITNLPANGGYTIGGQKNPMTFDLFSYGPDQLTYIATYYTGSPPVLVDAVDTAGSNYCWYCKGPENRSKWSLNISAFDDITY